jgi:hypothetical protein
MTGLFYSLKNIYHLFGLLISFIVYLRYKIIRAFNRLFKN